VPALFLWLSLDCANSTGYGAWCPLLEIFYILSFEESPVIGLQSSRGRYLNGLVSKCPIRAKT
jgi:hypothetical protein